MPQRLMRLRGFLSVATIGLACLLSSQAAQAVSLDFPAPATRTAMIANQRASYALPIAPWQKSGLPMRSLEGTVIQSAWQIEAPGLTSLDLMASLRAQLVEAGFKPLFECETEGCGGFDFRFGTAVLPEPDMHVDLGDFRFLSMERPDGDGIEAVSLLVSRSYSKGFVQLTQITRGDAPAITEDATAAGAVVPTAANSGGVTVAMSNRPDPAPATGNIVSRLITGGSATLEGLDFGSGSAELTEGRYASLAELAAWLKSNPDKTIALVGHTDASGGLEANIAISKRRAASVRSRLIETYGIAAKQVEAQGIGYLAPIDSNLTEEGRRKNRRVEAILTSTR